MRRPYNLDLPSLDRIALLIHGGYGQGKTHLVGDMLRTERANGPVRFLNIAGEDGSAAIGGMGLGEIAVTVDTYEDLRAEMADMSKMGLRAVGVDSMHHIARILMQYVTGSDRLPRIAKDSNEWGELNHTLRATMLTLRTLAPIVLVTCPSDRSVDQLTGKVLWTPDVPGRNAVGSSGWFNFVFVMKSDVIGPNKVRRVLLTGPISDVVIKAQLPCPLPTEIEVPENGGGWAKLYATIQKAFNNTGKEK